MKKFIIIVSALVAIYIFGDYAYYHLGWYIDMNPGKPVTTFVKTEGKEFRILKDGQWENFEIKGVNIGSGEPGQWSTDFDIDEESYYHWFGYIQEMGANTIRVYTIQADEFYNAFYAYNRGREEPLYLIHGVWVNDYVQNSHMDAYDERFFDTLIEDCRTLVDVLHGNKKISLGRYASAGSGTYKHDISQWVIGYILGVEWEGQTVEFTNQNYKDRPEYTRNIISTSYGYNGNYRNKLFYQVYPLQLNIVRLFDLDEAFYKTLANDPFLRNAYQDHFDLGSGTTLYYTTSPASIPEETYHYARLQFDIAGNLLSAFKPMMEKDENGSGMIWNTPYSQYVRTEATLGKTWVWGKNNGHSIATRLLAGVGYAYGNSTALPFEKHFYGGGANSLRGWQARTVGPGTSPRDTTFVIPNQTGDMKLEANIEYRFDIVWKLDGAVFLDAGNVWTLKHKDTPENDPAIFRWNNLAESIAANWGVGVRLNFGFLLLRVDMGMKIHDPARVDKWVNPGQWLKRDNFALHFGVGYPF